MAEIALPRINPWIVAMTVTLATFMEVLDTSIANVALPHIAGSLSATADESTWVLTSYLVSNAIILPMSGWLATRFGRKRFYMSCVVLFTLSSMLCGMAATLPMLILFRVMQGLGGGGLGPSEQAILADTFTPEQRNMGFAIYGMAIVVAPAIGPTLGGWITDNYSWHWIFFINVPIGILSLFLTHRVVHDPPHVAEARRTRAGNTDTFGIVTIVVGVGLMQYVLDKGQQLDWLDSNVIRIAAGISHCVAGRDDLARVDAQKPGDRITAAEESQLRIVGDLQLHPGRRVEWIDNFDSAIPATATWLLGRARRLGTLSRRACAGGAHARGRNPGHQIRSPQGHRRRLPADLRQHVLDDAHSARRGLYDRGVDARLPGGGTAADFYSHQHAGLCGHAPGRQQPGLGDE